MEYVYNIIDLKQCKQFSKVSLKKNMSIFNISSKKISALYLYIMAKSELKGTNNICKYCITLYITDS